MEEFARVLAERIIKHISSFEHKVLTHHPDVSVINITEYAYVEEYIKAQKQSPLNGYEFTDLLTEKVIANISNKFKATKLSNDTIKLEIK